MSQLPLIDRALAHPDRIAIRTATASCTYAELVQRSQLLAATLLYGESDLDASPVAYLVPPGPDYVAAQWGIWRAGGIAVPLGLSATACELEYALTDSEASTVVVTAELADHVANVAEKHGLRIVQLNDLAEQPECELPTIALDRPAMILYTSGTTSKPKGVVTTHACIQAQIESLVHAWRWQPDDRVPLFLPLHHIHGIINILSCALWAGAEIEAFERFDIDTITRRVAEGAYTVFMAVPTVYAKLTQRLEDMSPAERDPIAQGFAGMRLMVSGSAALPASLHQRWSALTGQQLLERYGMTEIGMALANPYEGERRPGTVGQPLPGVEIRLVAESGDVATEENVMGEIQVRGPSVFKEYWRSAEATSSSFVDDPHGPWFRTGDLAIVERGYYRIIGRSSIDIIKSGGYKLSALEIEASLLDHPNISQCAVVGLPDAEWGETVAIAVVRRTDTPLSLDQLRTWCEGRLSPYKIPRRLLVVDDLARNAMGKVNKPKVAEMFGE
jgi:malonyl-CoA/methylmalonyl-CoA synthetase